MNAEFKSSFARDVKRVRDSKILGEMRGIIEIVESAPDYTGIPNISKLRVKGHFYRIKVGDYRIGLTIEGNMVTFVRVLHRSEIYRYFP